MRRLMLICAWLICTAQPGSAGERFYSCDGSVELSGNVLPAACHVFYDDGLVRHLSCPAETTMPLGCAEDPSLAANAPPAPLSPAPAQQSEPGALPPASPDPFAPLAPVPISAGVQEVFTSSERIAALKVVTPFGDINYFIKVVTSDTHTPVLTAYIPGGQALEIDIPLGSYRLRYAMGRTWYGTSLLFGEETAYAEADTTLDFNISGDTVTGFTIELIRQEGGNLETRSLSRGDF